MSHHDMPKQYRRLNEHYPEFMKAYQQLGELAKKQGPLDAKTLQLVQLAGAVAIRSEGAVHSHARRALEAGASAEEVRHCILTLTTTLGFPAIGAAMSWVGDMLDK